MTIKWFAAACGFAGMGECYARTPRICFVDSRNARKERKERKERGASLTMTKIYLHFQPTLAIQTLTSLHQSLSTQSALLLLATSLHQPLLSLTFLFNQPFLVADSTKTSLLDLS